MLRLELPATRSRGRAKRRFMDVASEDMKLVVTPEREQPKGKEEERRRETGAETAGWLGSPGPG
ncbi:hypothetical protein EXN66_Car001748 [Channa argus]|uniref:Uncharacterized protein n=1 Tax=Channa argus TaxID=215402 RepID=A0A6G1R1D4_CHAAH|nr:hypothetical protein EXN66_Car001748 [Channa argus]